MMRRFGIDRQLRGVASFSPETLRESAPPAGLDHTAGGCSFFISLSLLYENTHIFILSHLFILIFSQNIFTSHA
jgi:hypothetical protein